MRMFTQILVRTRGGSARAAEVACAPQVHAVDPDQQVMGQCATWSNGSRLEQELGQERLVATLFSAFAVARAGALGRSGFTAWSPTCVAQRTNEFGIRMALGAGRMRRAAAGVRVDGGQRGRRPGGGVVLSLALKGLLAKWAGVGSNSPLLMAAVVGVLAIAASLACARPARRASSVDPMRALRYE